MMFFHLLFISFGILVELAECSPLLPFGTNHPNDMTTTLTDDSYVAIDIDVPFKFYGTSYSFVRVVSNGFIAFDGTYRDCCGSGFPYGNIKIAPLWDDLYPGTIYYRQTTTDPADLLAAENHVKSIYPSFSTFDATWALVATWDRFRFFESRSDEVTFQTILTTDGTNSFAIFLYEKVDYVSPGTIGIDAGDYINYRELCISKTPALLDIEDVKQSCNGEKGVLAFRVDTSHPNQVTCFPTVGSPGVVLKASYYCQWSDASETSIVVNFLREYFPCGIMAWDTQKYIDGENPNLFDPTCETQTISQPVHFSFEVDPDAAMPACGVIVTGTTVKTLDITIRAWNGDVRFDVANDEIYRFTCTTDTTLPASTDVMNNFNDIEVTAIPVHSRTAQLEVKAPNIDDLLTDVEIGQLIQLRIIYDNAANIEPYRVYVKECTVGDTMDFDMTTVDLIQNGCVVETDPDGTWYMSRPFQQTSLSAAGLFITDSGTMAAVKFRHAGKLFFRCVINFCFFTATDLCINSCSARKKRSVNETEGNNQVLYTSVKISGPEGLNGDTVEEPACRGKLASYMYIVLGSLGGSLIIAMLLTIVVFCKLIHWPISR